MKTEQDIRRVIDFLKKRIELEKQADINTCKAKIDEPELYRIAEASSHAHVFSIDRKKQQISTLEWVLDGRPLIYFDNIITGNAELGNVPTVEELKQRLRKLLLALAYWENTE